MDASPAQSFRRQIQQALHAQNISVRRATQIAGLPDRSIQGVLEGHIPSIDRVGQICNALGLQIHIGPASPPLEPPQNNHLQRVRDRRVASMLAWLADEYEQLNDHGRASLAARFEAAFPEYAKGGGDLRRIVEYLGWRVIDGAHESEQAP